VEALVLFDDVYLDGRTVDFELPSFRWLDELDQGFKLVNRTFEEVQDTYHAGMVLARRVVASQENAGLLSDGFGNDALREAGIPARYALGNTTLWRDVRGYVAHEMSPEVADFINGILDEMHVRQPGGAIVLARLCYYLALQQRLGSLLLLHPSKAYGSERLEYGYSRTILDMFDSKVRGAYLQRRHDWLGDSPREIPMPLLSRFVLDESSRRGWSLGRSISWLRTRSEVRLFRDGMRELLALVESGDHSGVDAVIVELDQAAQLWSQKLGAKPGRRKLSLQVAIPLLSPSFDVPLPRLGRTPAQKLLVLIDHVVR
jgi:hypothetical protein